MTDPYGSAPHDEEGHKEDASAEVWHDDRPPVDDFSDHPAEEAVASEEAGAEADQDEHAGEKKKRTLILPIAVGIVGVLFLGAMLYIQFGGSSSSNIVNPPPLTAAVPPPGSPSTGQSASASGDVDINSLYNASREQGQGKPSDAAPTTSSAVMTEPAGSQPAGTIAAAGQAPAAGSTTSQTPAIVPPQNAPISTIPTAGQPAVPVLGSAASDAGAVEARLNALTARMDGLQKSLDQATQQLAQVSNMVAASPVPAQPNPALEDRLGKMEQQLAQLEHDTAVKAPIQPSVAPQLSAPETEATLTPEAKTAPSYVMHKTKHKTVKRKLAKTVSHPSSKHAKKTANRKSLAKNTRWVLRAATPDTAWVSSSAASPELRRVEIGDVLPGIGRVRAIHQAGDNWVVEGSTGTIH